MPILDLTPRPSTGTVVRPDVDLSPRAVETIRDGLRPATWRAYNADRIALARWCSDRGVTLVPATPVSVVNYCSEAVETLALATVLRRVATWSVLHEAAEGVENPVRSKIVRAYLRGLRRQAREQRPREAAPLCSAELALVFDATPPTSLRGLRDRALIAVGAGSALRRSELVALDVEDLRYISAPQTGYSALVRTSKTSDEAATVWIHRSGRETCPVAALDSWLAASGITSGPLFRSVDRYGTLGDRLSDRSVSRLVREAATRADLPPGNWSGHSLRAGFVTEAARRGRSSREIARQTRHSPTSPVLHRYVRLVTPWDDNAAAEGLF